MDEDLAFQLEGEWTLTWWKLDNGNAPDYPDGKQHPWTITFPQPGREFTGVTHQGIALQGAIHRWQALGAPAQNNMITINWREANTGLKTCCGYQLEAGAVPQLHFQGFWSGTGGSGGRFDLRRNDR